MSSFVLVHGAWHGSWCWKRVRTGLQAQGHEVFTPTLTGVADRSHLLSRAVNLETHIQDVVNLIRWEELTDIVLCGHSYGGCVISGVADRMPEHIRALVYLDAFVLEDGENQMQHLTEMQSRQFREGVKNLGEGWKVPPIPAAVFNVNVADREWVDRQCTMQPIGTMQQPLSLTGGIQTDQERHVHPRYRIYRGFAVSAVLRESEGERVADTNGAMRPRCHVGSPGGTHNTARRSTLKFFDSARVDLGASSATPTREHLHSLSKASAHRWPVRAASRVGRVSRKEPCNEQLSDEGGHDE